MIAFLRFWAWVLAGFSLLFGCLLLRMGVATESEEKRKNFAEWFMRHVLIFALTTSFLWFVR